MSADILPPDGAHESRTPRSNLLALAMFVFVPSALAMFGPWSEAAEEKRRNESFPDVVSNPLDDERWARVGEWHEDRMPLRTEAIELEWDLASRIDNRYENALAESEQVSGGLAGWLFYDESLDQRCFSAEIEDAWSREVELTRSILETTGRGFLLAVAPDRGTVVPEHLLDVGENDCLHTNRQVIARLAQDDDVVDLGEVVTEESHVYQTDTHWSPAGALAGAQLMVETIHPGAWGSPVVESQLRRRRGDLTRMLGADIEEEVALHSFAEQSEASVAVVQTTATGYPLRTATNPAGAARSVALIHDSFGGYESSDGLADGSVAEYIRPWFRSFANVGIPTDTAIVGEAPTSSTVREADLIAFLFVQRTLPDRLQRGALSLPIVAALLDELDTQPLVGRRVSEGLALTPGDRGGVVVIDALDGSDASGVAVDGELLGRLNTTDTVLLLVGNGAELVIEYDTDAVTFVPLDMRG